MLIELYRQVEEALEEVLEQGETISRFVRYHVDVFHGS